MKIVLITNGRPELTEQTIDTMLDNAAKPYNHTLFIVYDGDYKEEAYQKLVANLGPRSIFIHPTGSKLGVGGAKNFGIECLEYEGLEDDDVIMFSDNDMYYLPCWDFILEHAITLPKHLTRPKQVGGWKHPYHQHNYPIAQLGLNSKSPKLHSVDAVTGNCFVIKYSDWKKYGPFESNAIGPGQSEDFALSQRIKAEGDIVATLDPPIAIHCGLANCLGQPATGYEEMSKMVEDQIKEYNISSIWLDTPNEGTILIEKVTKTFSGLNVGSGQRRFDSSKGWINVDHTSRPPDQIPDMVCDATKLVSCFGENTQDMVVLHHVLEHFGCGEADEVLKQCYKVLKPGGSLLIFVPDLRKLAGRWLSREIDDFTFLVNVYGAYQGLEGDRHRWGYDKDYLYKYLKSIPGTGSIRMFDWREIPGADIARDWWVLGMELVKD